MATKTNCAQERKEKLKLTRSVCEENIYRSWVNVRGGVHVDQS